MQCFRIILLPTPDCQMVRYLGEYFQSEERNNCVVQDFGLHFPFMWLLPDGSWDKVGLNDETLRGM